MLPIDGSHRNNHHHHPHWHSITTHLTAASKLAVSEEIVSYNYSDSPPERADMRMQDDETFGQHNLALHIAADRNRIRVYNGMHCKYGMESAERKGLGADLSDGSNNSPAKMQGKTWDTFSRIGILYSDVYLLTLLSSSSAAAAAGSWSSAITDDICNCALLSSGWPSESAGKSSPGTREWTSAAKETLGERD